MKTKTMMLLAITMLTTGCANLANLRQDAINAGERVVTFYSGPMQSNRDVRTVPDQHVPVVVSQEIRQRESVMRQKAETEYQERLRLEYCTTHKKECAKQVAEEQAFAKEQKAAKCENLKNIFKFTIAQTIIPMEENISCLQNGVCKLAMNSKEMLDSEIAEAKQYEKTTQEYGKSNECRV